MPPSDEQFGVSDVALARAAGFALGAGTAQLVIARGGDVLVDEVCEAEPVDVYAVQKGLVSVMFGIAQGRGLLDLGDPVSVEFPRFVRQGWLSVHAAREAA